MSSFAPNVQVLCDVYWLLKDGNRHQIGRAVDQFEAERLIFTTKRPQGAKFVCKIRR